MKKQKLSNLYPTAIRGDLKSDTAPIDYTPKKSISHIRDRSPGMIIFMGAIAAAALGLCMLAITYWYLS